MWFTSEAEILMPIRRLCIVLKLEASGIPRELQAGD